MSPEANTSPEVSPQLTPPLTQPQIIDMLRFHLESGCDEVLLETPINRLQKPEKTTSKAPENTSTVSQNYKQNQSDNTQATSAPAAPNVTSGVTSAVTAAQAKQHPGFAIALQQAKKLAASANNIEELAQHLASFDGCELKKTAKNLVFSDGNAKAQIMLIGEAPGREEDRIGKPFIGESGKLLDKMLAAIGLDRDNVYITNIVPWRPTGDRAPSSEEISLCRPFIDRHIELIAPKILLFIGGTVSKTFLDNQDGISKTRGTWIDYISGAHSPLEATVPALPIFHPAFLLRAPARKAETWSDLCSLKERMLQLGIVVETAKEDEND